MLKKALFSLFSLCALVILTTGCGKKSDYTSSINPATQQAKYTDDDAKAFLEKGDFTFVIGFDADFPPYGYQNEEGELVGFDLDLAKEVAKREGWKIELRPIDWDAKDAELDSGAINCIWNGFTINGREELYTWTAPYVDSSQVIMVRKNSGILKPEDLAGKIVEAQADSSGLKAINDESCAELRKSLKKVIEVPNFQQAFMDLKAHACDAVVIDYCVAMRLLKGDDTCCTLADALVSEQYGVGFKKGNTVLRDIIQKNLDDMYADGTFLALSQKWFDGEDKRIVK
ncbi:MAG: transporter substrate-binding domain-containing protein [Lentisphaeria bacterium]|nr:transporter substrate-binding domain-containing protein [Lentisphaeria bacterium]